MRRLIILFSFLLALPVVTTCTQVKAQVAEESSYPHVIILAFDGWGASSFEAANMPFLKSKLPESAWTLKKRSILPTSSACNWATMFKGVGPEAHGYIAWDTASPAFDITYADEKGNFPSVFSLFKKQYPEQEMGYFYQWEGMKYIFDMDDFSYSEAFPISPEGSDKMKDAAIKYIKEKKPGLAAFIWDYPDKTGHTIGWYTDEYMKELSHVDTIIESVVNACIEAGIMDDTLFIITSDHGGHEKTHHQPLMSDLETPFIMFGNDVVPGMIETPFMQYDIASIIADYLYLEQPIAWRGVTPQNVLSL
jgi:Uncharacterized proteins of the AP superfamily